MEPPFIIKIAADGRVGYVVEQSGQILLTENRGLATKYPSKLHAMCMMCYLPDAIYPAIVPFKETVQ